jgi:branched-chain amino acid transport system ATP-binding protein
MLRIAALNASIGKVRILHDIDLHVAPGETVCLIGANGAGKTTLMRSIAGLLPGVDGTLQAAGKLITGMPAAEVVRQGISLVPEGRQVFFPLNVRENLEMGAYMRNRSQRQKIEADLEKVLGIFPKLRQRFGQLAGTLSGGEQQMLAIGRALMSRPKLLLLDEPSLGLAPKVVAEIFEAIAGLGRQGTAILIAEQNANMAFKVASRGYVLSEGRAVLEGTTALLKSEPRVREAYLGV